MWWSHPIIAVDTEDIDTVISQVPLEDAGAGTCVKNFHTGGRIELSTQPGKIDQVMPAKSNFELAGECGYPIDGVTFTSQKIDGQNIDAAP